MQICPKRKSKELLSETDILIVQYKHLEVAQGYSVKKEQIKGFIYYRLRYKLFSRCQRFRQSDSGNGTIACLGIIYPSGRILFREVETHVTIHALSFIPTKKQRYLNTYMYEEQLSRFIPKLMIVTGQATEANFES